MVFDFKDGSGCGKTLERLRQFIYHGSLRVQSKMAGTGRCDGVAVNLRGTAKSTPVDRAPWRYAGEAQRYQTWPLADRFV